jgi:hypothetical protein
VLRLTVAVFCTCSLNVFELSIEATYTESFLDSRKKEPQKLSKESVIWAIFYDTPMSIGFMFAQFPMDGPAIHQTEIEYLKTLNTC